MLNDNATYNDAKLGEEARRLAYEGMRAMRTLISENGSPERIHAISQAVVAACSAMDDEE